MTRVLITGAKGFIGQHLTHELVENGIQVVQTDWKWHATSRTSTFKDLRQPGVFNDILDQTLQHGEIDAVIHLAAQVGRLLGEDDAIKTITSNAQMTAQVAFACAQRKVRLVYTSTSEVYGDQGAAQVNEDGPFSLPHNLYGLSKRWGEEACQLYAPANLVIIRPSMPYGPGAPPGRGRRAMDNMLWQAHHRMPITVHKNAERSWCWIGDLASAYRLALNIAGTGTFNAGRDDDPRSMKELAKLACNIAGAPEDLIVEVDPPSNQTAVKRLSTNKLRSLGWVTTVDLEEGMTAVYEWIKTFDEHGERIP